MRDTFNYTNIYTMKDREIMVLKEAGSYSFLQMDIHDEEKKDCSHTEVIVPADQLEEALSTLPSSSDSSPIERMELLFGSMDGFDHFITYCDEYGIDTRTFTWD